MDYFLRKLEPFKTLEISITNDDFQKIKNASDVLVSAFALEEAYDLVVANYIELEQEILSASVSEVCRESQSYNDFFGLRSTINRRFVNLLSTCRSYLDQTPQLLTRSAENPSDARNQFNIGRSKHYDASFSYRFFEALRNHVQHCGGAVHRFNINSRWVEICKNRRQVISVEPITTHKFLSLDSKFKKSVLDESDEEIPLLGHLRAYMEAIGNVHEEVRSATSISTISARAIIEKHINDYAEMCGEAAISLAAVATNDNQQKYEEIIPLTLEWDDVRLQLKKRNSNLQGLANKAFISYGS
jgi:hypothetical protein